MGGYPEWLDYCEDLIFDLRLRNLVGPFVFAPEALVYFRPRPNLRAFFVQYYRYARGDGKADLWRRRHAIRYLTYLVAAPLVAAAGGRSQPLVVGPLSGGDRRVVRGRMATAAAPVGWPEMGPEAPGGAVGAGHPRHGRCRQDGRLSGRPVVAMAAPGGPARLASAVRRWDGGRRNLAAGQGAHARPPGDGLGRAVVP